MPPLDDSRPAVVGPCSAAEERWLGAMRVALLAFPFYSPDWHGPHREPRLRQYLSALVELLGMAALPVGTELPGGIARVRPGTAADMKCPTRGVPTYVLEFQAFRLKSGDKLKVDP